MKLDPTYVLEPLPAPKTVPTRRAILLAGAAGFFGLGIGFGSGYWVGHAGQVGADSGPSKEALRRIEWARDLARTGSDSDLLASLPGYLGIVHEAYGLLLDDDVLWAGVARAAKAVVENDLVEQRGAKARALLVIIKLRSRPEWAELRPALARVALR